MSSNYEQRPNLIFRFLGWICPDHLVEEIEGDLIQRYQKDIRNLGERRAKYKLIWNTIRFFRPGIILRNKFSFELIRLSMLRNYFKTVSRHILRHKINFGFKLGGLTLALFSFLAIAIYVSYQLSFDTYHDDYESIYRVNSERKENGVVEQYAIAPLAVGAMLQEHFAEVVSVAGIRFTNGTYLRYDNKATGCEGLIEADSSFFDVLTFHFIQGNSDALKDPHNIVLTKSIALNLFGSTDVLQKTVTINNNKQPYQVAAVIDDVALNSHFYFQAVVLRQHQPPFTLSSIVSPVEFVDQASTLFVRFRQPMSGDFAHKAEAMLDRYIPKKDRIATGFKVSFQPIDDVYLGPQFKMEFSRKGNAVYVYAFSILGVLLLIVAGINYINLSIADFSNRSRETGVRKVLGARRFQIIGHVTFETLLYIVIALSLATALLYILFPQVVQVLDPGLRFNLLFSPAVVVMALIAVMILIFFSAYFPAQQFASSHVTQNLKSKGVSYNSVLSRSLLLTQFVISVICISCTLMMDRQINFIHTKELGFDRNNLVVLSMPEDFSVQKMQVLKQGLKEIAGVTSVSNSSFRTGGGYWKDWYFVESENGMREVELYEVFSDDELFTTLNIPVLKGRTFDANIPSDSVAAFVINETAARELGWRDPVGKRIYTHPEEKGRWDGTVVGVVADLNISPLYEKVRPLVMRLPWQSDYPEYFVYVRYEGDAGSVVKSIEKKYNEIMPGYPLAYRHVDEFYNGMHDKEDKAFTSLRFGTLIIVVVSLLGIFSLASYLSVRRMKEFGIRKVLGASVQQIASLHLGYFMRIVLISNVVALPLAWWITGAWLDTFAYRVDLSAWPFLLVTVLSILLVAVSGAYSALKAGRMNPVDVIKIE